MEVDGEAPQVENAEIQSSKRKVIRVESEETQDYVCETLALDQEEAEEIAFVPSASANHEAPIYWCDNRCSEKAVRHWQIASVVVEEGGEAHTVNLCQRCYKEQMVHKPQLKSWQWRAVVERKAHRWRIWKVMGNEQFKRGKWVYFTHRRAEVKKILADASRERQEGIQGQWQQASSFREILEQVRGNAGVGCRSQMMRRGYLAMRDGSWEEFKERYWEEEESPEWTLERIREAHEKVAKYEIDAWALCRKY